MYRINLNNCPPLLLLLLPTPKKNLSNPPLTKPLTPSQTTQTEPTPKDNQEQAELKTKNQELEKDYRNRIREKESQITNLQSQIRDLAQRPLKPTNSKFTQTDSETDLSHTLDTLIKNIQALNNEL